MTAGRLDSIIGLIARLKPCHSFPLLVTAERFGLTTGRIARLKHCKFFLFYGNKRRLASRLARSFHSQSVINAGHYQRFKHPHVTRSQPIGIAKLYEVFMNTGLIASLKTPLFIINNNLSFKAPAGNSH